LLKQISILYIHCYDDIVLQQHVLHHMNVWRN